ncbi:diguanylate cyclase [Candidatus Parcubacteria bacterium]|nr:diguanylate cyclase [Patescibacteria group bacterium]MBU4309356.1 diguanylate cyclase [Patescibacteria group bacterium]MBU4431852.1 diguanylate cyclase [Patescibacteria group bacterium]MBU4577717.1 diguanylate cyclase [Patescibacteria group bacterium]MCG2697403.1 diguanylate cyclase [Candidatus Parcubacteria bacterium]
MTKEFSAESSPAKTSDIEKRKQQAMTDLAEIYDKENNERTSDANYEAVKNNWIAEQYRDTIEVEDLNDMLEEKIFNDKQSAKDLQKKYEDVLIDDVTGFKIRKELFKKMDEDLRVIFGLDSDVAISNDKVISAIQALDDDCRHINLSVMMSDVSYLSLANEAGHSVGDKLLKNISEKIKSHGFDGYRHGGDEITALVHDSEEIFQKKIQAMSEDIRNQKNVANLANYDLVPNLDIGTAHISEGLKVFKELLKIDEYRGRIKNEKALDELKDVWLEIADKRSFLEKGKTRISLLMDRFSEDRDGYKEVIGFLRKGGYNINDEELGRLVVDTDQADKAQKEMVVKRFIAEKEKQALKKLSGYRRSRAELINQVVGII